MFETVQIFADRFAKMRQRRSGRRRFKRQAAGVSATGAASWYCCSPRAARASCRRCTRTSGFCAPRESPLGIVQDGRRGRRCPLRAARCLEDGRAHRRGPVAAQARPGRDFRVGRESMSSHAGGAACARMRRPGIPRRGPGRALASRRLRAALQRCVKQPSRSRQAPIAGIETPCFSARSRTSGRRMPAGSAARKRLRRVDAAEHVDDAMTCSLAITIPLGSRHGFDRRHIAARPELRCAARARGASARSSPTMP